jgi:hypothetical protein
VDNSSVLFHAPDDASGRQIVDISSPFAPFYALLVCKMPRYLVIVVSSNDSGKILIGAQTSQRTDRGQQAKSIEENNRGTLHMSALNQPYFTKGACNVSTVR